MKKTLIFIEKHHLLHILRCKTSLLPLKVYPSSLNRSLDLLQANIPSPNKGISHPGKNITFSSDVPHLIFEEHF